MTAEVVARNCLHPCVALVTSPGADAITKRSALGVAELLFPFRTHSVTLKVGCLFLFCYIQDPTGKSEALQLTVDFRDLRDEGHLLSLTVLPSVLHEVVGQCTNPDDVWIKFTQAFHYWFEPAENDFLKAYISCVFVVSMEDEDPLAKLELLIQQQNELQHSTKSSFQTPAYCTSAKWFLPHILKYMVLMCDKRSAQTPNAEKVFSDMCAKYGAENCQLLIINSVITASLPDLWTPIKTMKLCLDRGLAAAREDILNSGQERTTQVSERALPVQLHGQCLGEEDRKSVNEFVNNFVTKSLLPFVERQLVLLNEAVLSRRGIGKSLTNMRKWLNVTGAMTPTSNNVTYTVESTEMQCRRLADLAFLFGAYSFAFQQYQSLKKDFLNDQAWFYHAGTLEMAALSSLLCGGHSVKSFPVHYIDNAFNYYLDTCMQPLMFFRSLLFGTSVLEFLKRSSDAANAIIRLMPSANLPEIFKAVSLLYASRMFEQCGQNRKQTFYMFLAARSLSSCNQKKLYMQLLENVLNITSEHGWHGVERNVVYTLVQGTTNDLDLKQELSLKLLQARSNQTVDDQSAFLNVLIESFNGINVSLDFPMTKRVELFIGTQPCATYTAEQVANRKCLVNKCISEMSKFTEAETVPTYISRVTADTGIVIIPVGEKCTLRIRLSNPLNIPLVMNDLRLQFSDDAQCAVKAEVLDIVRLEPCADVDVCLSFTLLHAVVDGSITGIQYSLRCSEGPQFTHAAIPLVAPVKSGQISFLRLKTTRHMPNVVFTVPDIETDGLDTPVLPLSLFCGQAYKSEVSVQNQSSEEVDLVVMSDSSNDYAAPHFIEVGPQSMTTSDGGVLTSAKTLRIGPGHSAKIGFVLFGHVDRQKVADSALTISCWSGTSVVKQWSLITRTTVRSLLNARARLLDGPSNLCSLTVRNVGEDCFSAVEILDISVRTNPVTLKDKVELQMLCNRSVVVETGQEDTLCFKVRGRHADGSSSLSLSPIPGGMSAWSNHFSDDNNTYSSPVLFMQLTWKARVTTNNGKSSTIYGCLRIPNMFLQLADADLAEVCSLIVPNVFLTKFLSSSRISLSWLSAEPFQLSPFDVQILRQQIMDRQSFRDFKFPWSSRFSVET